MKTYLSRFFVAASSVLATALTTTAVAQTVGSRAPRPMVRPNVAHHVSKPSDWHSSGPTVPCSSRHALQVRLWQDS